jgi:hypothetical protein
MLHCLAFQFGDVISGMLTYKPLALKNTLLFVVQNLGLSMLVVLHLSAVLNMVARLQEEILGTTFRIVWAI